MCLVQNSGKRETLPQSNWPWKVGLVIETPEISTGLVGALSAGGATCVFSFHPDATPFEISTAIERDDPELLFVELSRVTKRPSEWIAEVRRGSESPLVVAVHPTAEPNEIILALQAGASEFLCLPIIPAIHEAMERIGGIMETRRTATVQRGHIAGILSAKGGCGATSIACHLSAALNMLSPPARILVADLDYQSPGAHHIFRASPRFHAGEAFDSVRRLSSASWRDFVTEVTPSVDLLASPGNAVIGGLNVIPEPWRVESLFRFAARQYAWILTDLGRHLNPANWIFLQNLDELFIVTVPDVLALYQTRSVLQTLSSRGFDKSRIRIILNRNPASPQDFWVESIEQMFEMPVFAIVPNDYVSLDKLPRNRFEFPGDTPFGKAISRLAHRLGGPGGGLPAGIPAKAA